ncbi:CCA tRNA nucleotidyltransferase [Candidatus Sumerlaeota bacterium]|nr:CCA tRNA nucleotidyltransferase [Candidatus Sumerlaeota bacterium]
MTQREASRRVAERLREAGHNALWVGGCVRDTLLGLGAKDHDLATDARPEQVESMFDHVDFVGAAFGVCLVREGDHTIEVATFRSDGRYSDNRRPDAVRFGTIEEDARRRDFTVNALFMDPLTEEVTDLVGGLADLGAKTLRCVGDPRERFAEDHLRLLRAVRFAARLDFRIEGETLEALRELAPRVTTVSGERICEELRRMLEHATRQRAFDLLDETGLLAHVLPEVEALRGVEQSPNLHPEGDVFVHTRLMLEHFAPDAPFELVLGGLLHDVGKAPTHAVVDGVHRFPLHQRVGEEMAEAVCRRLKMSTEQTRHVCGLVARHMKFLDLPAMRRSTRARFLGGPHIEDLIELHRVDILASCGNLAHHALALEELARLREETQGREGLPEPLLRGRDLLDLGMSPGPAVGALLREIETEQLEGHLTTREEALEHARRRIAETL